MTRSMTWKGILRRSTPAVVAAALALPACSSEKKEPDCVPAAEPKRLAEGQKIEMTPLQIDSAEKEKLDWCRACIMGPKGYASCQRVYARTPTEPREEVRKRAREKACVDSGFPADACPTTAEIGIVCKGDPPPPNSGDPAKALQNMYQKLNPPPAGAPSAGAPEKSGAPVLE